MNARKENVENWRSLDIAKHLSRRILVKRIFISVEKEFDTNESSKSKIFREIFGISLTDTQHDTYTQNNLGVWNWN